VFFWGCLLLLSFSGCVPGRSSIVAEKEEIAYRRGQQCLREGRPDEGLRAFLSVIERRPDAPESHLEVGLLYLNRFNEPVLAVYHFNEYLRLKKGNSDQAERVRELIITAKKEFARSLPAAPFGNEIDKLDLKELLNKTRAENETLKAELQRSREDLERYKTLEEARLATIEAAPNTKQNKNETEAETKTLAKNTSAKNSKAESKFESRNESKNESASEGKQKKKGTNLYIVQEHDSLSSISKKFYGVSNKWKEIYEANRRTLPTPNALKLGQTLTIP
jgi:hypothetical protein